jgi:GT2 family glycosyltransferase
MRSRLPVVAAIPNYNMADSLSALIPDLLEDEYDQIFVLDDASTDHSLEIAHSFGKEVTPIAGHENIGSGGNRNRIIGRLGYEAIIHFIDADMQPETRNMPEIANEVMNSRLNIGFVGGLVRHLNGMQHEFNYGPRQCLRNDASVPLHLKVLSLGEKHPELEQTIREKVKALHPWPNPRNVQPLRRIFWASEANMLISSKIFEALGGYDPNLRDHDIQDLAIRSHKSRLASYYTPDFGALHTAVQVRNGNRTSSMFRAELYIARKHGLLSWIRSRRSNEPAEQFLPPVEH